MVHRRGAFELYDTNSTSLLANGFGRHKEGKEWTAWTFAGGIIKMNESGEIIVPWADCTATSVDARPAIVNMVCKVGSAYVCTAQYSAVHV